MTFLQTALYKSYPLFTLKGLILKKMSLLLSAGALLSLTVSGSLYASCATDDGTCCCTRSGAKEVVTVETFKVDPLQYMSDLLRYSHKDVSEDSATVLFGLSHLARAISPNQDLNTRAAIAQSTLRQEQYLQATHLFPRLAQVSDRTFAQYTSFVKHFNQALSDFINEDSGLKKQYENFFLCEEEELDAQNGLFNLGGLNPYTKKFFDLVVERMDPAFVHNL
ncbi:MAG: hypothetical protein C0514_08460 [Candidatus Puniceispirillum sp.]|nr:hypothetical protein [Candidatus Puniceispirillum sp.]